VLYYRRVARPGSIERPALGWRRCPWTSRRQLGIIRNSEHGVILYAKGDFYGASVRTDQLRIEDILAIEHDVIPLDGADMFQ
jgi:hypothetical protein